MSKLITQKILAGWSKRRLNRPAELIEYWKSYIPGPDDKENMRDCSVCVRFGEDYYPSRPFMVWFRTGGSFTPLPNITTVRQLNIFLELVIGVEAKIPQGKQTRGE